MCQENWINKKKLSNTFLAVDSTEILEDNKKKLCQWHIRKILGYRKAKKILKFKMVTLA